MMCKECDFVGPELPWAADAREIHRALHGLGRVFLEWLDPIVEAIAGPAVKIPPLENLDRVVPGVPEWPGRNMRAIQDELSVSIDCLCAYRHVRAGLSGTIVKTVWTRNPDCRFDHSGGTIRGWSR